MFNALARAIFCGVVLSTVILAAGCGSGVGPLYPVEGRVLLDGKPLEGKDGTVALKPDANKGNTIKANSFGMIQRDGKFSIQTNGSPGAPLGWYKIIIVANEPESNPNEDSIRATDERYEREATTPLAIEVVASPSPGYYDLNLSP